MKETTLQYEDPEDEDNAIEVTGGSFCWTERLEEVEISASRENLDEVGTENAKDAKVAGAEKLLEQNGTRKHTYMLKDIDLCVPKVMTKNILILKSVCGFRHFLCSSLIITCFYFCSLVIVLYNLNGNACESLTMIEYCAE